MTDGLCLIVVTPPGPPFRRRPNHLANARSQARDTPSPPRALTSTRSRTDSHHLGNLLRADSASTITTSASRITGPGTNSHHLGPLVRAVSAITITTSSTCSTGSPHAQQAGRALTVTDLRSHDHQFAHLLLRTRALTITNPRTYPHGTVQMQVLEPAGLPRTHLINPECASETLRRSPAYAATWT